MGVSPSSSDPKTSLAVEESEVSGHLAGQRAAGRQPREPPQGPRLQGGPRPPSWIGS